jgi:hypothetical protein
MPLQREKFDRIIMSMVEGLPLAQACGLHAVKSHEFYTAFRHDPVLARDYQMACTYRDGSPPKKDWVAEVKAAIAAKRARRRDRTGEALVRLEAKIAARRAKKPKPKPPTRPKMDDLKKSGDVVDIFDLKRRGALDVEWTVIQSPARHPGVEKMVAARFRLQIYFRGRDLPQSIPVVWHKAAIFEEPQFCCGCGRRARKIYPTVGAYRCRYCATGATNETVPYKSRNKSYDPKRIRKRPPVANAHNKRDPGSGRFLPARG